MTFEEWWNTKDYPATCKGNCMEAFNAGLHADVHTDNSKVIAELKNRNSELARQKASLERWLGEAKNLLNEFVKWANWQGNSKCPSFKSIQDKAEQFLKEEENDSNS